MKKLFLSLLLAFGAVSGLNAAREEHRERWEDGEVDPAKRISLKFKTNGLVRRLKPKVDNGVAQQMCKLMNNPKNFKSMGMNKCHDCRCDKGTLVCQCSKRKGGPVVRFKEVEQFLDFNDPKHHPVIMVTEKGDMELVPLRLFEMEQAYQEKYVEPKQDHQEKILSAVR